MRCADYVHTARQHSTAERRPRCSGVHHWSLSLTRASQDHRCPHATDLTRPASRHHVPWRTPSKTPIDTMLALEPWHHLGGGGGRMHSSDAQASHSMLDSAGAHEAAHDSSNRQHGFAAGCAVLERKSTFHKSHHRRPSPKTPARRHLKPSCWGDGGLPAS